MTLFNITINPVIAYLYLIVFVNCWIAFAISIKTAKIAKKELNEEGFDYVPTKKINKVLSFVKIFFIMLVPIFRVVFVVSQLTVSFAMYTDIYRFTNQFPHLGTIESL